MEKNAKIGYFANRPSGCSWYRIYQPMEMLARNGIKTQKIHLNEDVDDDITAYQFYGAMPFSLTKVLQYLKQSNKKIICDSDDALELIDNSNPFYFSVKKDSGSVKETIGLCDEITVSTPAMADYMRKMSDKPITVIPNCYTSEQWNYPRPKREGIRIGFAGSSTHIKDLINIIPIIERLKRKYPIIFIIMGFGEEDYQSWFKSIRYTAPTETTEYMIELDKRLSKIDFEWVSYIETEKYPSTLLNMALDIGLCPLEETPFNKCRSACKAMEYTLSGALALASDVTAYRNDKNSILVKDNEWEDIITYYIEKPQERNKKYLEHLAWTKENRNIETQLVPLKKVYDL